MNFAYTLFYLFYLAVHSYRKLVSLVELFFLAVGDGRGRSLRLKAFGHTATICSVMAIALKVDIVSAFGTSPLLSTRRGL